MIVVISDLHLQHVAHDGIRRRDGERVLECGVTRNIGAGALRLLFSEIAENVVSSGAREVHLVLAGDIFELHRTPTWLTGGNTLRPATRGASASLPLREKATQVFEDLVADNREFFATLAECVKTGRFTPEPGTTRSIGAPLRVHFIPGNHDRLVNVWPELRRRVRELLCMTDDDPSAPFPHLLDWTGYALRVRHGHEYDAVNFAGTFDPRVPLDPAIYDQPSLGDYVTVDIAARLAVSFRVRYAKELRAPGPDGDRHRDVYLALTEFDDVRPSSALVRYLAEEVGQGQPHAAFELLRPVLRDLYQAACADPFFIAEAKRQGLVRYFQGVLSASLKTVVTEFSAELLTRVIDAVAKLQDGTGAPPASFAARELGLEDGRIRTIVAGHTHQPDHVSLPTKREEKAYFLDSGTWRTRIDEGMSGSFGRLRSYTMVFCYREDEWQGSPKRPFETWIGHLLGEDYGAYRAKQVATGAGDVATVEFTELAIGHVDEGDTRNGAELALRFGVDGEDLRLEQNGVHDGDRIALAPETFRVKADGLLDGELWCWGSERDRGDSPIDPDDPLPWAVDFLTRSPQGPFERRTATLLVADNRGTRFTLSYRVV